MRCSYCIRLDEWQKALLVGRSLIGICREGARRPVAKQPIRCVLLPDTARLPISAVDRRPFLSLELTAPTLDRPVGCEMTLTSLVVAQHIRSGPETCVAALYNPRSGDKAALCTSTASKPAEVSGDGDCCPPTQAKGLAVSSSLPFSRSRTSSWSTWI